MKLYEVLTLPEACSLWNRKDRKAVLMRIWREERRTKRKLIRRSGPVYLVETDTMIRLWGPPTRWPDEYEE